MTDIEMIVRYLNLDMFLEISYMNIPSKEIVSIDPYSNRIILYTLVFDNNDSEETIMTNVSLKCVVLRDSSFLVFKSYIIYIQNFTYIEYPEILCVEPDTRVFGHHISKQGKVCKSLQKIDLDKISETTGYQMFLRNPKSGRGSISHTDIYETLDFVESNNLKIFCHDVYIVNLSNPNTKIDISIKEMQECVDMGFSGMVVHCGKQCKMEKHSALEIMEKNIRLILENATESCPLILETCSGQGTELLHRFKDFVKFYNRFDTQKLKICVDTCHVFAAGHDPYDFVYNIHRKLPDSIALIHLNGSKNKIDSRLDRHCPLDSGYIDRDSINHVIEFCKDHSIPIVAEW